MKYSFTPDGHAMQPVITNIPRLEFGEGASSASAASYPLGPLPGLRWPHIPLAAGKTATVPIPLS